MGLLTLKAGDMFASTTAALAHGVNVDGLMGAGVAAIFRRKFPAMHREYVRACRRGDLTPGSVWPWKAPSGLWVYNLASQDRPGPHARLEWVEESVKAMLEHAQEHGVGSVAMPRIGCGIGGLHWADVEGVLGSCVEAIPGVELEVWSL